MANPNDPIWWGAEHESTWTRVKDALRRDWEQTKKDFGDDDAVDLNQGLGDTLKQAAGKQAFVKSADAIDEEREAAREDAEDRAEEIRDDIKERAKMSREERIEAAREAAEDRQEAAKKAVERVEDDIKNRVTAMKGAIDTDADTFRSWDERKASLRFGAGAAHQYTKHTAWNAEIEDSLKSDWEASRHDAPWTLAREDVRSGFLAARRW